MDLQRDAQRVLALYPPVCDARTLEPLETPDSFSGARIWHVDSDRGRLALRRWPKGHPDQQRLEFIQAVLWHVDQEGFHDIPLPLETQHKHGYVWHAGHLWELTPWLPGKSDFRQRPSPARLQNALAALARFHHAASQFPVPEPGPIGSPGIAERLERLEGLMHGHLAELQSAVSPRIWPELEARAGQYFTLFTAAAPAVLPLLRSASRLQVRLQPCIRDIWHAHVLFVEDAVSGLVDFGSMRPENVAADVARLLGSLIEDDADCWQVGLNAYRNVRPMSDSEEMLVTAFDRSSVLMSCVQWLEWVYLERRTFAAPQAIIARFDGFLARLVRLAQAAP
jgi:Ser/Thr protein kinase RdoA (MazF antagonist)